MKDLTTGTLVQFPPRIATAVHWAIAHSQMQGATEGDVVLLGEGDELQVHVIPRQGPRAVPLTTG